MTAQNSTNYPFIGEVAGERGGISVLPAVDPALFTAPTATFTQFKAVFASLTMGTTSIQAGGLGYFINKFNGTTLRVPCLTNA